MTRKHFEEFAKLFGKELNSIKRYQYPSAEGAIRTMAVMLADYFQKENPNFNRIKFFDAIDKAANL